MTQAVMSVEVGLWRVDGTGSQVRRVDFTPMPDEAKLEAILAADRAGPLGLDR